MSRERWSAVVLVAIGLLCLLLLFPYLQTVRVSEGWVRTTNSIKQIGFAFQNYHDVHGRLPPSAVTDKDGRPLLSWRVAILPYVENDNLSRQFRHDEAWDSPHNAPHLWAKPRCYAPTLGGNDAENLTRYQVFVGPGTAFERPGLTWTDFPDGRENTLLVVEAGEPVPWSKPADLPYDPTSPLPLLGAGYTRPVRLLRREIRRNEGFATCFADGSTRFVLTSTNEPLVRAVITRNGGEQVDLSALE
jgi:hypothetical protein